MSAPRLEPEPGEIVYLIDRSHSPWVFTPSPYDPALHRDGIWAGDIARMIDNVTGEQWRIAREAAAPEVS